MAAPRCAGLPDRRRGRAPASALRHADRRLRDREGSAGPDRRMGGLELTMTEHQHPQESPSKASRFSGMVPGLIKGLATTTRTLARPSHTVEYPDVKPYLPPRTRGVIALIH